MRPFNKMIEAYEWVEHHAQGPVGVIQSNARIMMTPWCRGDMRVLGIFFEGVWQ